VGVLRDARLVSIQSAGHIPQVEAPEQFFPAVEAFLHGRWPPNATRSAHAAVP
jgi:pimeloyl-ACP methyl ester carboxylesterase